MLSSISQGGRQMAPGELKVASSILGPSIQGLTPHSSGLSHPPHPDPGPINRAHLKLKSYSLQIFFSLILTFQNTALKYCLSE